MKEESPSPSSLDSSGKLSPKFDFVDVNSVSTSVKPKPVAKSTVKQVQVLQNEADASSSNKPCDNFSWPSLWQNGPRRSAFQPYKPSREAASSASASGSGVSVAENPRPASTTALTNLQRGNIQANPSPTNTNALSWFSLAGRGDLTAEMVQQARDKGEDLNREDADGLTALMWAAFHGQTTVVQALLSGGAVVDREGWWGETALSLAAAEGHLETVRLLLLAGADVNHEDHNQNTALMCAVAGDHPHTVSELLLNQADPWLHNDNGCTAYDIACSQKKHKSKAVLEKFTTSLLMGS